MHINKILSQFNKKDYLWTNVMLLLLLIILVKAVSNKVKTQREGFQYNSVPYSIKENKDIFDTFYVGYYDSLMFNYSKNLFEISEIIKLSNMTRNSKVLDVGSGTGHHVSAIAENDINVIGLDSSTAMVNYSKNTYPTLSFRLGNAENSKLYYANSFSHILCLSFTIYYIKSKKQFFNNCMKWLMPGGYLVVHLVDKDRFTPIIPNAITEIEKSFNDNETHTKSQIKLNDYEYTSIFIKNKNNPKNACLREKFIDVNNNVRVNEHTMFMDTQKNILSIAKKEGFILFAQLSLELVNYQYQYIYILQKPN